MKKVIKNILQAFLDASGLNFDWQVNIWPYIGVLLVLLLVAGIYIIAWSRVNFYTNLMDRYLRELWSREEYEVKREAAQGELKRMRLERVQREYRDKINKARRQRDTVLKKVPLLRWWYRRKRGQNSPMLTLPY